MAIIRFNPVKDLLNIEREFNRLFNSFDKQFGFGEREQSNEEYENAVWMPLADIYEDKEDFKLKLDLPGLKKEDVKISYSNYKIAISGERRNEEESENYKYHRVERAYGRFYRSFDLPEKIQDDKISADFSDGQLTVTIPKAEEAKPKEISIKIN